MCDPLVCSDLLLNTADAACVDGGCAFGRCASGLEDCDGVPSNGCERDVARDGPCLPNDDCRQEALGPHTYLFCEDRLPFDQARERCRAQPGGDLSAINSGPEDDFVFSHYRENLWIGAREDGEDGLWRWVRDGVPFWRGAADGELVGSQYANWNSGRPNVSDVSGACVEMFADGTWSNLDCGAPRAYVCETGPDECPDDPAKTEPGQCGCGTPDTDGDGDGLADCGT